MKTHESFDNVMHNNVINNNHHQLASQSNFYNNRDDFTSQFDHLNYYPDPIAVNDKSLTNSLYQQHQKTKNLIEKNELTSDNFCQTTSGICLMFE
jgi:hypothetical protein